MNVTLFVRSSAHSIAFALLAHCVAPICAEQTITTDDALLLALLKENATIAHSSRQPWRIVQDRAKDSVVQIFAQKAEIDLLQPYQTPSQYGSRGSGFFIKDTTFITDDGYIITNAHVVDFAVSLWIQIPSQGKQLFDVELVSICPERDLALLRLTPEALVYLQKALGEIPFLTLGDSDAVYRSDEVLALGYPLGQESLKSTSGVVSGREWHFIQISAPINPGNSGGPLLNVHAEVIGVNTAAIPDAQNVGYSIPANDLRVILPDLMKGRIVRKPRLGIVAINATPELTAYYGNPQPGGAYIIDVVPGSPLHKAGIETNDMIYSINGCELDIHCQIQAPWSEERMPVMNYISRLITGDTVDVVLYRNGQRMEKTFIFEEASVAPIRHIFPPYEAVDYEVFAGMVVMQLSINHVKQMKDDAPGLVRYYDYKNQTEPVLLVTHLFANSQLSRSRTLKPGATLNEINGQPVKTLADFRAAMAHKSDYFTIKACDNAEGIADDFFVVLSFKKLLAEHAELGRIYHFPLSDSVKALYTT